MARVCTICMHPARTAIDDGLIAGQSLRLVSGQFGLSKSSLDRHKSRHLPAFPHQERADLEAEFQAARQADHRQYNELRKHARAAMRAFEGWGPIRSEAEWQAACEDARERY